VRLILRLIPGKPPTEAQGWNVNEHVLLGKNCIHSSDSGGSLEFYRQAQDWEDLAEAAGKAIAFPPEAPFEISVRMEAGKNNQSTSPVR